MEPQNKTSTQVKTCGLVMPISSIDGCDEQHWLDVKSIISDAVEVVGFSSNLVSFADDVGIIQKRIIQNLYENPIVVCDVSGKNPNVMFELGLRLAFDKPTIIIKDDKTTYSFDTSPIEHLEYPRDLRFTKIVEFKDALGDKVKATYDRSISDPNYTTFLKHFGTFTAAKIDTKEVTKEDFIIEELKDLRKVVEKQEREKKVHLFDDYDSSKNYYIDNISDFYSSHLSNLNKKKLHQIRLFQELIDKCESKDELIERVSNNNELKDLFNCNVKLSKIIDELNVFKGTSS